MACRDDRSIFRRLSGIGLLCAAASGASTYWSGVSVIVLQDTATWLAQEYAKQASLAPPRIIRIDRGAPSEEVSMDSARVVLRDGESAITVKVAAGSVPSGTRLADQMYAARRVREIFRIPAAVVPPCAGRTCNLGRIGAVYVCDPSGCHGSRPFVVRTRSVDSSGCQMGVAPNLPNDSSVLAYMREKLGKAFAVALLERAAETPEAITFSQVRSLAPTSIPSDLALRSPLWVADSMGWNLRTFQVTPLFGLGKALPRSVRLKDDWRSYKYLGDTLRSLSEGEPAVLAPRVVGDSLLLMGPELRIEDSAMWCALAGGDMWQRRWNRWLVMPDSTLDLQATLAHGAPMLETGKAWPIENDTLLVGGRRLALSSFMELGTTSLRSSASRAPIEMRRQARGLEMVLPAASQVLVADLHGGIVLDAWVPQGRSLVALPEGRRGLLVVRVGGQSRGIFLP